MHESITYAKNVFCLSCFHAFWLKRDVLMKAPPGLHPITVLPSRCVCSMFEVPEDDRVNHRHMRAAMLRSSSPTASA